MRYTKWLGWELNLLRAKILVPIGCGTKGAYKMKEERKMKKKKKDM